MNPDKIIEELILTISGGVEDFSKSIPAIQKKILSRVIDLAKDFIIPAKSVKDQATNLKLIAKIKGELEPIIMSKEYKAQVTDFTGLFDDVEKLQNTYFSTISTGFKANALLKQIKKTNIELTVDKLTENGLNSNVTDKIRDILNRKVVTGSSFSELVSEVSDFLTDKEGKPGALSRYARQITNDSLNVYSAQYTKAVTDDLGLTWYKYVGTLVDKSRAFCKALIAAKEGCMPYIHESQLNEIAKGNICGKTVSLEGLYKDTDGANLQTNRGGWNCGHQLMPVSEAVVPKALRDKFS